VDRKRIIAVGNSAGGHLALMLAMAPASADLGPSTKIAAVVDFFGVADVAGPWIPEQPKRMELVPVQQSVALKVAGDDADPITIRPLRWISSGRRSSNG
jgi:acetyl esterase/lipase